MNVQTLYDLVLFAFLSPVTLFTRFTSTDLYTPPSFRLLCTNATGVPIIELIRWVLNVLTGDQTSFRTGPTMFDKIVGYDGIKRTFVRSLTSKQPVHILLVGPPGQAKFFTEHTGQFTQGYVEGFNSVPGIPKDYKAGYQNGTNEWDYYQTPQRDNLPHSYACPFIHTAPHSNFCKGYDAALAYQNSDI
jgi:hypothetical protein